MSKKKPDEQETLQYINNIIDTLQQVEDSRKQAQEALQQFNELKGKMETLLHAVIDSLPTEWKCKREYVEPIERHNQICPENQTENEGAK